MNPSTYSHHSSLHHSQFFAQHHAQNANANAAQFAPRAYDAVAPQSHSAQTATAYHAEYPQAQTYHSMNAAQSTQAAPAQPHHENSHHSTAYASDGTTLYGASTPGTNQQFTIPSMAYTVPAHNAQAAVDLSGPNAVSTGFMRNPHEFHTQHLQHRQQAQQTQQAQHYNYNQQRPEQQHQSYHQHQKKSNNAYKSYEVHRNDSEKAYKKDHQWKKNQYKNSPKKWHDIQHEKVHKPSSKQFVLRNMRHPAFLGSNYELNDDTVHELVVEAIKNHGQYYDDVIAKMEQLTTLKRDAIIADVAELVCNEYESKTSQLRQKIIDDGFGAIVYAALKEMHEAHLEEHDANTQRAINAWNDQSGIIAPPNTNDLNTDIVNMDNSSNNNNVDSNTQIEQQRKKMKVGGKGNAYVTYCLLTDEFFLCCCTLGMRLQMEACKHPKILLLPSECFDANNTLIEDEKCAVLKRFYDVFYPVDIAADDVASWYLMKQFVFSLTEYDKLMFMEPYSILNDDQLEIYFDDFQVSPSSSSSGGRAACVFDDQHGCQYETFIAVPNQEIANKLYEGTYGDSAGGDLDEQTFHRLFESATQWQRIENETDKDEWLFTVTADDVDGGTATSAFVVAFFSDANPWDLHTGKDESCIAVRVWMQTARKLIKETPQICKVVSMRILKRIMPELAASVHGNAADIVDDDGKDEETEDAVNEDEYFDGGGEDDADQEEEEDDDVVDNGNNADHTPQSGAAWKVKQTK